MKTPKNAVDHKKLSKFITRINREARKLFHDGDGDSRVLINVEDLSRNSRSGCNLPVPYDYLLETDAEWRDAMRSLSANLNSATDKMDRFLMQYNLHKDREEGYKAFQEGIEKLSARLHIEILLDAWESPPKGMKWTKPCIDPANGFQPENMIQVRNLFEYRKAECDILLDWAKGSIQKWLVEHESAPMSSWPSVFMIAINSDIAHLYVSVPIERK